MKPRGCAREPPLHTLRAQLAKKFAAFEHSKQGTLHISIGALDTPPHDGYFHKAMVQYAHDVLRQPLDLRAPNIFYPLARGHHRKPQDDGAAMLALRAARVGKVDDRAVSAQILVTCS